MKRLRERISVEPYWIPILLFWLGAIALFLYHQFTGKTPGRVVFTISLFGLDLDVYWYGVLITSGIALGSWVVSRLALEQARQLWRQEVSAPTRRIAVGRLGLPEEVPAILAKREIKTLGELLFLWGLNPQLLGLNRSGQQAVRAVLLERGDVMATWLDDAPWRQWNPDHIWSGIAWCIVLALIGARLYHVLTPPPSMAAEGIASPADYFKQPLKLINVRAGGLGIYGGLAGGAIGLLLYTRRQRISALQWADLGVVGLALGQAIGRWGNFLNQELYGAETTLPWAITIDARSGQFHPAFLYESLWNFGVFLLLFWLVRRMQHRLRRGDLMATYLAGYAGGRIITEMVRLDSPTIVLAGGDTGVPIAMAVSAGIALAMLGWMYWRHRGN